MKYISDGYFISLEGVEGTGKSTQCQMITERLTEAGYAVKAIREPGGTVLGEKIRELVKHRYEGSPPVPVAELLLMGASRAQLMQEVITKELEAGKVIVCDRFADSTTVYQGFGRNLDLEFIDAMHKITIGQRAPDITFLLDIHPDLGLKRAQGRNTVTDVFEKENLSFHRRIREGFLQLAEQNAERMKVIRADNTLEKVNNAIMDIIINELEKHERLIP